MIGKLKVPQFLVLLRSPLQKLAKIQKITLSHIIMSALSLKFFNDLSQKKL